MYTKLLISKIVLAVTLIIRLLFASAPLFAQVKIGTAPTTINANNNLEVEASTSGRKTSIDKVTGQLTIADGTQGLNKVLTSDANGAASWQPSTLVRATVTYINDGQVTVPLTPSPVGYATGTYGNIDITFPENGTYAVSWAFIGDFSTAVVAGGPWLGVALGTNALGGVINHQQSMSSGSLFIFSDGVRYVTITSAPITLQVKYISTNPNPFVVRKHSTNNYNEWFAYKVF